MVGISSTESWIPGELLHDGRDFLSRRFSLFRLPRRSEDFQDTTSNGTWPIAKRTLGQDTLVVGKILNVIGGGLSGESMVKLEDIFEFTKESGCVVENLRAVPISELKRMSGATDILHFTCHGKQPEGRLPYLQISPQSGPQSNFLPGSVNALSINQGCLVFINACRSETPQLLFKEFVSFGWKFYNHGSRLCVGTLISVPQRGAIEFSREFYRSLFDENLRVSAALAKAREKLMNAGQYFPLFYCVYGDPGVYLTL